MDNLIEFDDYFKKYLNLSSSQWISLYENIKDEDNGIRNDLYAIATLTKNTDSCREEVLKQEIWGFSISLFGKSYFQKIYSNGSEYIEFASGEYQGIYEYLITERSFNDKYTSIIEINPKLIWYKNLVKVGSDYLNPDTDEVVIKCDNNHIEVKKEYLKDFLSAYGYICVISFDHRRFFSTDSEVKYSTKNYKDKDLFIQYAKNSYTFNKQNAMSSIIGKVIVNGYKEPLHNDYREFTEEKKYENFIIGQEHNTGKPIEFTCNADKLGNLFGVNQNAPQFLTPVYFNKRVLNNYITDTKNYKVMDSLIVYLDKWSLPYTINDEGKVIVWLGDLGRIPFEEQKLWKIFNEVPTGEIEELFYKRQIECEWTESSIKEKGIFNKLKEINKVFKDKYGEQLFNDIAKPDEEIESAILIPATNSVPVYQNFLMQLCKITVERINKKFIKTQLTNDLIMNNNGEENGSRILLYNYLTTLNMNSSEKIDKILKIVYNSRNKLSGHTASVEQYNKVWGREKNYNPNYISDANSIIISLYNALSELLEELRNV